jgi:hypothetical protein
MAWLLGMMLAVTASATTAGIDFAIPATVGGSITFSGVAGAPLVGVSIGDLGDVTGVSTPLHDGETRACLGCTLNFTTGGFWKVEVSGSTTTLKFYPGGSISVTGTFDANGNNIVDAGDVVNTTLLDGEFLGEVDVVYSAGGPAKVIFGTVLDTKDPGLTSFFGLPSSVNYTGTLNLSFLATVGLDYDLTSTKVLSGDLFNSPVPEPGTYLLVGMGLLAVGLRRFRRQG